MPNKKQLDTARRKLRRHLKSLATIDSDIAETINRIGYPEPRLRDPGFSVFLHTIVSQQISVRAADSIWSRVLKHFDAVDSGVGIGSDSGIDAEKVSRSRIATLRKLGMSERKAEYAKGVAKAFCDGSIDPGSFTSMDDEAVIESITALRGFGRWSAEIYLMFSLQRPDVFAADDLILRSSLQKLKGIQSKLNAKQARELVEPWQPYRSAGSLFLWHMHHCEKASVI